jgi:hypothetical protein
VDIPLFICGNVRSLSVSSTAPRMIFISKRRRGWNFRAFKLNVPAQLVAEAVAAFNAQREPIGLPPLAETVSRVMNSLTKFVFLKVMPGIVMIGTSPTFFKVPVTQSPVNSHSSWSLSSRINPSDILLSTGSPSCPSLSR